MKGICLVAMNYLCQDGQYITDAELDPRATMHRETVGLIDDQKVLVLVDNPSTQRLSKYVGVDPLQLLCEPH